MRDGKLRIGISGGTFDPIHMGHIVCAREVKEALSLDKVIFIPSGTPPHKIVRHVTDAKTRFEMVREAIKDIDGFECSDMEISRDGYTYSIDTLREIRRLYGGDAEIFYIIGTDVLGDLTNWRECDDVFNLCSFAAIARPGDIKSFEASLAKARGAGADVIVIECASRDVSSSAIRDKVKSGVDISGDVPPSVEQFIKDNALYLGQHVPEIQEIIETLTGMLSQKRLQHSIGVMNESVRLARIFHADEVKCKLAGILHDCGRDLDQKQLGWMGLELGEEGIDTIHGKAGALIARQRFGICDPDVLEAIEFHTTGRPGMGRVAQIVFVADYTEEGRVGKHFDLVRQALTRSLEDAILMECDMTIKHIIDGDKRILNPDTVQTRNWIVRCLKMV